MCDQDVCSRSVTYPYCVSMVAMLAPTSASAKRRARTQRVAVRKAVEEHIEADNDGPVPAVVRVDLSSDLHGRLSKIEASLESLLHQVCFNSYWFTPWLSADAAIFSQCSQGFSGAGDVEAATEHMEDHSLFGFQHPACTDELDADGCAGTLLATSPNSIHPKQGGDGSDVAAECSHVSAKGDFRSLPPSAWKGIYEPFVDAVKRDTVTDADVCAKCEALAHDCICWDIYCRNCHRTALNCAGIL